MKKRERNPLLTKFICTCNRNVSVPMPPAAAIAASGIERDATSLPKSIACRSSCLALLFFLFQTSTSFPPFPNSRPVSASQSNKNVLTGDALNQRSNYSKGPGCTSHSFFFFVFFFIILSAFVSSLLPEAGRAEEAAAANFKKALTSPGDWVTA